VGTTLFFEGVAFQQTKAIFKNRYLSGGSFSAHSYGYDPSSEPKSVLKHPNFRFGPDNPTDSWHCGKGPLAESVQKKTAATNREIGKVFFEEGRNCWQIVQTDRVAFLIDGEAYFKTLADACERAQQAVYIIGWDVDSRIRLRRGRRSQQETLGTFVDRLTRENPALHIYILGWDFAVFYSLEREFLPLLSFGWKTHERVHFALDANHPVGASHHQKIVVVDDRLAFVGGIDLTSCRWDTSEHAPEQVGRQDNESAYEPFHDMQMMVDGKAASELGRLVRDRWQGATGEQLPAGDQTDGDPWPKNRDPDLENVRIALLRTVPEHNHRPQSLEIENFYRDAISQAKTSIYIENQYLTSQTIGRALENALQKKDGPEILILLPHKCSGWLEKETMGALREHLLQRLKAVDAQQKLKVCYPDRADLDAAIISVHSKVLIVDDALMTIGSANLSNRSMGFDTECNLALSTDGQPHAAAAIVDLRNRLLAEHMGTEPAKVAAVYAETGSLLSTVAQLNHGSRLLQDLPVADSTSAGETILSQEIVDPERPIDFLRLLDYLRLDTHPHNGANKIGPKLWGFAAVLLAALILTILWRWSPLQQWLDLDTLLASANKIRESPWAVPIVLLIYLVGCCVMVPVTLLILITLLSFGPFLGFVLALAGSLLGGLASYLLGRWLGRDAVRKLAGEKLNSLNRKLAEHGWLAIAIVRNIPIAPFTVVNMVAGSTHISLPSFIAGTAIGMVPGITAIAVFERGLERALRNPGWESAIVGLLAVACAVLILIFGKRWLVERKKVHDD
jgi:phosphatidylserine/phosphatidylglycerophosphate/cardiolipin synthase-like enzyme/uncharacterized membrane protein YdjX (TVP38/TMEM64 family)